LEPVFLLIGFVIACFTVGVFIMWRNKKKAFEAVVDNPKEELIIQEDINQANLGEKPKIQSDRLAFIRQKYPDGVDLTVLLSEVQIQEIMTSDVQSIKLNAPFNEVPKTFQQFSIRHLPVVDPDGKLVGLITQRDMYKIHSPRKLLDGKSYYDPLVLNQYVLAHVMVKDPYSLFPENSIGKALTQMIRGKYGSIPIVNTEHVLCGIVTRNDILALAAEFYESY